MWNYGMRKSRRSTTEEEISIMVNRSLVPSWNPYYRSCRSGSIAPKKTKIFLFPRIIEECPACLDAIPLKRKINNKESSQWKRHWPNSYATVSKKGKVRPRDKTTVWPDHQHILPPSQLYCPAPPLNSSQRS